MNAPAQLIAIGKIGRPHGVEGAIMVYPLGETLAQLTAPCEVILSDQEGGFSKTVTLTESEVMNQGVKCKFTTFDSPEASESLKGLLVTIAQENLPQHTAQDAFYHFELKGMAVISDPGKTYVGEVVEVHNYPTTDALEIKKEDGHTFTIGLDPNIVRSIDRKSRTIMISLDLLDEII